MIGEAVSLVLGMFLSSVLFCILQEVVVVTDFASKLRWLRDYLLAPSRTSVVVTCVSCDQELQELTRVSVLASVQ